MTKLSVESLMELYVVTERRDGAVFKTQRIGEIWVEVGAIPGPGEIYVPLSTERAKELMDAGEMTIRACNHR